MIVASTPLRISLFGGSTDNPEFIKRYEYGSVISFPSSLRTYVALSQDKFGINRHNKEYVINYSHREQVLTRKEINNDIVRLVLEYFQCPPISLFLTSDVYSHGSGLASSSSYLISLIKAVSIFCQRNLSDGEICKLALELEQKINPHCGYQDPYGCGIGGFKRMEFIKGGQVKNEYLPTRIFKLYDFHLIFTGITRNSKDILKDVGDNAEKALPLLDSVESAYASLLSEDYETFLNEFNLSWELKKETSPMIMENASLVQMDKELENNPTVLARKLCGAGNGGFFLVISKKDTLETYYDNIHIDLSLNGLNGELV